MFYETIDYTKNKDVNYLSEIVKEKLKGYDINSFMLGIKSLEEDAFLKKELHSFLIKNIEEKLNCVYKTTDYDVEILVDLTRDAISFEIRPVFVYGRYCKYTRNIAQTYHYCPTCKGKGCIDCDFSGKKTKESIQEIVYSYLKDVFVSQNNKFHGAGREDVDVLMLGDGREFVIELIEPKKRNISKEDFLEIQRKINKEQENKISVNNLKITNKEKVVEIKQEPKKKIYEAVVSCEKIENINILEEYKTEFTIKQKTPTRVKKRRVDMIRERNCKITDYEKIDEKTFSITLLSDAGLYIKEFVSGDDERSIPNLSSILNSSCVCKELNVIKII
jgi:tRNA pseudouridine synthase 10